ncbi:type IV secretory system conjugative DNA transfer family protein [Acinetobacter sp. DSM 11652]|uniref:type IV secretory system conjugative DNA transfer family protein n=1 Tax=Acinetobacter sp. DSM 11652 TaxID=346222 RepID=UPI0008C2A4DB|nr:type IV secretory system conjugative DNA transfer family protein [Acinetobacter sp. DSM 11652]SEM30857.1 type IV secretion system protein VirD4 [Acinetobacter sp. DSM 11652]
MSQKEVSITRLRLIGSIYLVGYEVILNGVCTQYIAKKFAYHAGLGQPVIGSVYNPFNWFKWLFNYYNSAPEIFNIAFIIFALGTMLGLVTFVIVTGMKARSSQKHGDVHGTAHFATAQEVIETGLMPSEGNQGKGVYCGAYDDLKTGRTHYLRHDGPEHICALAPTRSGKGVGLVLPTLLSWPHSVFVLDRKGENYAMTAGWRKEKANNVVLRFDPAEPNVGCSWNPLAEVRFKTRYQVSDAQNIALMVIDDDGKGISGDHFRSAAFELLNGLILHALYKGITVGRTPCLQDCGHMLTGVGDFAAPDTENDLDQDEEGDPKALLGLFHEMRDIELDTENDPAATEAKLVISGVGRRMAGTPARELGSIISTANNALSLYRDPIVGENTSRSDFTISDLMDHDRPVSLYFITTPRNADRMRPLARLLLTQMVLTLADQMEFDNGRSKTVHKHRLLLLLDEFPTLGKLEVFESALAYIAGYGMKAYLICQDVQQLYKAYTNYESIISNCHIRVAYAPNKVETAEWMSKMTGQMTVVKEQISTSGKRFGMVLDQVSRSYQEIQRPLMTPDEIMRLPGPTKDTKGDITKPGEMLVFVAGNAVIRGRQILYFLDPVFSERSRIKPPQTDVVRTTPKVKKDAVQAEAKTQKKGFKVHE